MKSLLTPQTRKYIVIASISLAAIIALIWMGYLAAWTGFADYTKPNSDFVRGKTLWDWLQLFIIPIFLSIGVFLLNRADRNTEREIATDRQREAALQSYLDKMTDLLLKEELLTTSSGEVRNVARTRTLTVLRGLDAVRKGIVLQFLYEAELISKEKPIINLKGANLEDANLVTDNLEGANLAGAILRRASLINANLAGANLTGANLADANLFIANLTGANLESASLSHANLTGTTLFTANLKDTSLEGPGPGLNDLMAALRVYADPVKKNP